jgi:hypothetical protein
LRKGAHDTLIIDCIKVIAIIAFFADRYTSSSQWRGAEFTVKYSKRNIVVVRALLTYSLGI